MMMLVQMIRNSEKLMKHTRSTTIAANIHSARMSCIISCKWTFLHLAARISDSDVENVLRVRTCR